MSFYSLITSIFEGVEFRCARPLCESVLFYGVNLQGLHYDVSDLGPFVRFLVRWQDICLDAVDLYDYNFGICRRCQLTVGRFAVDPYHLPYLYGPNPVLDFAIDRVEPHISDSNVSIYHLCVIA